MAWYLDINPTNQAGTQYVTIPSWNITGDFKIEIDCEIYNTTATGADGFAFSGGTSSGGFELYRDSSANTSRPSLWRNNTKNFVSASNVWPYVSGSTAVPRRITIQRIGNTVSSDFAGTAGTNITIATGDNIVISAIGARSGGTFTLGMRLYRMKMYQAGSLVRDYDPSASGGSGVTLTDTVSGQNGTFQNPPAANAQWVFYDAGGATTAAAAFSMPQMSVASSGSSIAPSVTASSVFTMPQFTVDSSASASVPTFTASASVTMPQMSAAISGSVVISGNAASLSFAMPQMAVAGAATDTAPSFAASIVATMPQMQVQCQALSVASGVIASINMTMPQMSVFAIASDTSPAISASIGFTMPQFSVYAVSGGFSFYESDGAHIETIAASNHLEYTYQSTHIEWRA